MKRWMIGLSRGSTNRSIAVTSSEHVRTASTRGPKQGHIDTNNDNLACPSAVALPCAVLVDRPRSRPVLSRTFATAAALGGLLLLSVVSVGAPASAHAGAVATSSVDSGPLGSVLSPTASDGKAVSPKPDTARLLADYGKIPLSFEANRGQTDRRVNFLSRGPGYSVFLTGEELVLTLTKPDGPAQPRAETPLNFKPAEKAHATHTTLRMQLVRANRAAAVSGKEELPGKSNYFIGNDPKQWRTGVPNYGRVEYARVYPGIDLVYYGHQRQLEHDFVLAPGANPKAIRMRFAGSRRATIDRNGDLVLALAGGEVRWQRPRVYQEVDGVTRDIEGAYVLRGKHEVGFRVGSYDTGRTLVIDPVLTYSTYLGGSNSEAGAGIAVDAAGNAYVTGSPFQPTSPPRPMPCSIRPAAPMTPSSPSSTHQARLSSTPPTSAETVLTGGTASQWTQPATPM